MAKYPSKTIKRSATKADLVKKTAAITQKSESTVYKVLKGDRENEDVMSAYMALLEGSDILVEEVKKLVPFNQNN